MSDKEGTPLVRVGIITAKVDFGGSKWDELE
jgi:hypothetical protein